MLVKKKRSSGEGLTLARISSLPKRFRGLAKLHGHSVGDGSESGREELSSTSGDSR